MADAVSNLSGGGSDPIRQILIGLAIVVLLYVSLGMAEYFYTTFKSMWKNRVLLFPDTYNSGTKMFTALQNPSNPSAITVYFSDNQRSGIEFSYSLFVNISSATFANGNTNLYHIMHKGYSRPYPLMGPGIFCRGDRNTLRIYMNSFDSWNNFTEIDNIPVDKWFHLVVSCKGNTLFAYINGNLKQKLALANSTPPYQNYGNVYLFSTRKMNINPTVTESLISNADPSPSTLVFDGTAIGMASTVYYFGYALSYSEIQALMNEGPSPNMNSSSTGQLSMSPYLADTWWSNNGTVQS
jgi:hypothetical protein